MASFIILKLFLLLSAISLSRTWALNSSSSSPSSATSLQDSQSLSSIKSICKTTPYPDVCFDSLKLSIGISININPNIITYLLQTLQTAISESENLSNLFLDAGRHSNIIEKQRGTIQDCKEVHQITLSALQRSVSRIRDAPNNKQKLDDARAYLSAALTNKNTCLEGLDSASGPLKPTLLNSIHDTYKHVSNSLSILSSQNGHTNRRLMDMGVPTWISRKLDSRTRILESEYDHVLTVATDGTGNFTTITDAINFAPNNSYNERTIIYVKQGVYEENVEIPDYKPNIVLLGDGADVTLITGNRSMGDGWTTFRSATLVSENTFQTRKSTQRRKERADTHDEAIAAVTHQIQASPVTNASNSSLYTGVSGDGFLARDISIENKAGAKKYQAVALRISADLAALYRCSINGFQDTLYVHSFRQFYRECDISGTIDFIFGNAAVVFQGCNIVSRMPMHGQFTVITAQSRDTLDENTGISIQNCSILAANDLYSNSNSVKSYLGRPWRVYSQTVYLESYIDNFIDPTGWTQWARDDDRGLDTLYYGEYDNYGPGSSTDDRVTWPGYHAMDISDAYNFTVSEFITGGEWLDSTSFPYDDGV